MWTGHVVEGHDPVPAIIHEIVYYTIPELAPTSVNCVRESGPAQKKVGPQPAPGVFVELFKEAFAKPGIVRVPRRRKGGIWNTEMLTTS